MTAPKGIHIIRARPLRQKDIGDDAIVERIHSVVEEGTAPSRLVLITDDKGLIRRMPFGVRRRSPHWLACEIVNFLAETELGHRHSLTPSSAPVVNDAKPVRIADTLEAKQDSLQTGASWRHWWDSLRSLPTRFWSFAGLNHIQDRPQAARTRSFERS